MKMNRKLILFLLFAIVLTASADMQSRTKYRAAKRKAELHAQTYPATSPSTAVAVYSEQTTGGVKDGLMRVEWVEFITPQTASVSGLFNVAIGFARGSREFCEILDLAGRLFSTDPTACINAAGVALLRGDAPTARMYLKDLMTDPRAYNNIGLLYLLEGNRDKAEGYLQLATANGTSPGSAALNHNY